MSQQSTAIHQSGAGNAPAGATHASLESFVVRSQDFWLLVGRLAIGAIFVTSGFEKLLALDGFAANLAGKGVPLPWIFAPLGACVEFFGGVAIVLGLATRLSSLLMIAFVVVATLISHRYWELTGAARVPQETNFYKNLAIGGGFFFLFAAGSGRFSLDRLFGRGKSRG
jgi:putative oxidoreductase